MLGGDGSENPGIFGGPGDDYVHGGDSDEMDIVWGELGNDRLYGGPGDDIPVGGPGEDELYGGPGSDALQAVDREWPDSPPAEVDYLDCGPGDDYTWADPIDVIDVSCERFGVLGWYYCEGTQCDGSVVVNAAGGGAAAAAGRRGARPRRLLGAGHFKLRRHRAIRAMPRTNKHGRRLVKKRNRMRVVVTMEVTVKKRGGGTKVVRKRSVTTLSSGPGR